jgi:hypothetical protein
VYKYNVKIALLCKGTMFCCSNHMKFNKAISEITVVLITDVYQIINNLKLKVFES